MKTLVKTISESYVLSCIKVYAKGHKLVTAHANSLLLIAGAFLLTFGLVDIASAAISTSGGGYTYSNANFDETSINAAVSNLFALIEGSFGALVMVVAGIGAIIAAAMGAYRLAVSMLVVAVGAFILRSLVSLFFGTFDEGYGVNKSVQNISGGGGVTN